MPFSEKNNVKLEYIEQVVAVFEALFFYEREMGIAELSRELGFSTSKMFRLVHALSSRGYLRRNPVTRKFRLGMKLWELGCAAVECLELREVARPFLEDLMKKSGESVYLAVLDNYDVVYIDRVESMQPVRAGRKIGGRVPAFLASTGKAILAFEQPSTVQDVLLNLTKDNILKDAHALKKELSEIRSNGYSINLGKWNIEVGGVGAPIFDYTNKIVAAISITGPIGHFNEINIVNFCQMVKTTAEKISKALGANLS